MLAPPLGAEFVSVTELVLLIPTDTLPKFTLDVFADTAPDAVVAWFG